MSDYLPIELQGLILKRLPVKSLIQFRSVSKQWKSLIDSSDFILHYTSHLQHLLVNETTGNGQVNYVSIADDDTFPQHKVPLNPPQFVSMLKRTKIIGCSHGLLCLNGKYQEDNDFICNNSDMAVIWNPSIRKAVAVVSPDVEFGTYKPVLGFGVCPETTDPKIVSIPPYINGDRCEVEVFTLSTHVWRSVNSIILSTSRELTSIKLFGSQVVVGGFVYWLAYDMSLKDGDWEFYVLIISFNLTSEEFGEVILLPDILAYPHPDSLEYYHAERRLYISKIKKSLVVLEKYEDEDEMGFFVWMMRDGSFTKLFRIYIPDADILFVPEFMKSGKAVMAISHDTLSLAVYEPTTEHTSYLGFRGFCYAYSYMETLLLLDQPDFIVYDASLGEPYIAKRKDWKGKMKADEGKSEPCDNILGEKMDMMEKFNSKSEEGIELMNKKLELEQQKMDLKRKKLEVEQQKIDLKRKKLELEQQMLDLNKKKADMDLLCTDTSKMAPENLAVYQKLVAEILKNYG